MYSGHENRRSLAQDQSGATLAYVSLFLTAFLGITALSFDLGRHYIVANELQKAADAAALAGAFQLDVGEDDATVIARVNLAAGGTPITGNEATIDTAPGPVTISQVRLLSTIPSDDDETLASAIAGPPFNYVEVTTQARLSNNVFGRVLGGQPDTVTVSATAVAQRGQAICQVTPLAVCNPAEQTNVGANFDPTEFLGHQILVRQHGGPNTQWAPGNFGFLDVPGFGNGARGLADALGTSGADRCFGTTVETEPGQTNGARNALNTRFDLYENPFFGNSENDPQFPPSDNVRKGYDTRPNGGGGGGNFCNNPEAIDPADPDADGFRSLPRDIDLTETNRFGNGMWMCADYWQAVHPGVTPPAGCGLDASTPTNQITRFEVYRFEADNGLTGPGGNPNLFEDGAPMCSNSSGVTPVPDQLQTDRRIVTMAVLNCLEHNIRGSTDAPVEAFINGFITEPVATTPGASNNGDILLEVVGTSRPGEGGVVPVALREWVELVR